MTTVTDEPTYVTLGGAARYKKCSATWIDRLHRDGRLPAIRTGDRGMRLFNIKDIDRLIAEDSQRRKGTA